MWRMGLLPGGEQLCSQLKNPVEAQEKHWGYESLYGLPRQISGLRAMGRGVWSSRKTPVSLSLGFRGGRGKESSRLAGQSAGTMVPLAACTMLQHAWQF